jgi:hypothetical protein
MLTLGWVFIELSSRTAKAKTRSKRLRAKYKGAFDEWALQVSRLQAITGSAAAKKEAEERVAAAETSYRDSRDRLMDNMVSDSPKTKH